MTNFTIDQYIKQQLNYAELMPSDAEKFYDHAFGAVDFALYQKDAELERRWNEIYKPAFERIIYG